MDSIDLRPDQRLSSNVRFNDKKVRQKKYLEYDDGSFTAHNPSKSSKANHSIHLAVPHTVWLQIEPATDDKPPTKQMNEPAVIDLDEEEITEPESTVGSNESSPARENVTFEDSVGGFHIVCRSEGKCGDQFESLDAMMYHMKTYHERRQKENTFECYFCKKIFSDRQSIERHMNAVHTGRSMFTCPFPACSRSFNQKFNMKTHINRIHTEKMAHECTKCTRKFYYRQSLTNHLANKHGKGLPRAHEKLASSVKCSPKAVRITKVLGLRPKFTRMKSSKLQLFDSKKKTSNLVRLTNERDADSICDKDNATPDQADANRLVKNEPAIDIGFDDVDGTNADPPVGSLSLCDERLVAINSEINDPRAINATIHELSVAAYCEENGIIIKNEPDIEYGRINLCNPLLDASCPKTSLIKDETDSEVDIDDYNYFEKADSLTHVETSLIDTSSIENEEVEIGHNLSTMLKSNFATKDAKTVNGNVDRFTVPCLSKGKCKDLFESRDAMLYHVQTYHARKQKHNTFQCHYCKKILGEKQSHQRHMSLYHFGRSLFKCSFGTCSKSFPRQDYLEKHINAVHTKRILIKCPECPKTFTFKQNMKWHLAYEHNVGVLYNCHLCKKKLGDQRSLRNHIKSQHTIRGFPFKCPVCSRTFKLKRYLRKHFRRNLKLCRKHQHLN